MFYRGAGAAWTYHLNKNTAHNDDTENVCADMRQLVISRKRQFERNTETLHISFIFFSLVSQAERNLTLIAITLTLPTKEQILR